MKDSTKNKSVAAMTDLEFIAHTRRGRYEMLLVSTHRVKNFKRAEQEAARLADDEIIAQMPALEQERDELLEKYSQSKEWQELSKL